MNKLPLIILKWMAIIGIVSHVIAIIIGWVKEDFMGKLIQLPTSCGKCISKAICGECCLECKACWEYEKRCNKNERRIINENTTNY